MDTDVELRRSAQAYFIASLRRDYAGIVAAFYPGDVDKLKSNFLWCVGAMSRFGEHRGFLELFGPDTDVEDLRVLSPSAFLIRFLEGAMGAAPAADWQDVALTFRVLRLERVSEDEARLEYSYEMSVGDSVEAIERSMTFQKVSDTWYVPLHAAAANMVDGVRRQVLDFQTRESRDPRPSMEEDSDEEPEAFALWGYRDSSGRVVLEPRFREAGKFESGLAPVKVFKKWGYIDRCGRIIIPATFDRADAFSEGLAAVAIRDDDLELRWGYIGTDGCVQIAPQYGAAEPFCEGVAEVEGPDGTTILIDRRGRVIENDE